MIKIVSKNQKVSPFYTINDIKLNKPKKFSVIITKKLHQEFIKFSGDNSPIHQNMKFLKRNNFKEKMGHGFLITSILSKIYGKYFPGGTELCIKQTWFFRKPFFVGDTFQINILPKKKNIKLKLLEILVEIKVKKKIIFNGEATFILNLK